LFSFLVLNPLQFPIFDDNRALKRINAVFGRLKRKMKIEFSAGKETKPTAHTVRDRVDKSREDLVNAVAVEA
jgi:hypothetical protein